MATRDFVAPLPPWLEVPASYGWAGVDFFFVLSGFIIYYSAATRPAGIRPAWSFYRGRVVRIYGPYLPIGIALAIAYMALPQFSAANRQWSLLTTATLLPLRYPPALSVAWTLQHEMLFYTIFALSFYRKMLAPILAIWAAAICLAAMLGNAAIDPSGIVFSPLNFEFMMGVAAAHLFLRGTVIPVWICTITAPIALYAWWATGHDHGWASIFLGLPMAMLIVALAQAEERGGLRVYQPLIFFGAASYSIYLIHNPLLSLTQRVLPHIIETTPIIALCLGVIAALAAGAVYHLAIEKKLTR